MDYTVLGILQARKLEWGAFAFCRGSSQPRNRTQVSLTAGGFFTSWATREDQEYCSGYPIPSPEDLPNPGIEVGSPALQADSLSTELLGKPGSCLFSSIQFYPWTQFFSDNLPPKSSYITQSVISITYLHSLSHFSKCFMLIMSPEPLKNSLTQVVKSVNVIPFTLTLSI